MSEKPFFSICIPAYKNAVHLTRLLKSLEVQTFKDYEVVISDDSPDEEVLQALRAFGHLQIKYYKNEPALGTPENWNRSMNLAQGTWLKLMHNDDWFVHEQVLQTFAAAIQQHPDYRFFFAAFQNVEEETGKIERVKINGLGMLLLRWSPLVLFRKVYVGNPSCTLIHHSISARYDKRFKFVVDFEYYIRLMKGQVLWKYIDDILISVGFHKEQVTQYTKYNPAVQIPENHQLLRDLGAPILKNLFVFDYYWRLYRNLGIRSVAQLAAYDKQPIPIPLDKIVLFQSRFTLPLLRVGIVSKTLMLSFYLLRVLPKRLI
ncbi:MAG TPA: glycosyltransferase [Phnomibacter sp.]|nr:glycosyltransferase [Phnomibacter sp.]